MFGLYDHFENTTTFENARSGASKNLEMTAGCDSFPAPILGAAEMLCNTRVFQCTHSLPF